MAKKESLPAFLANWLCEEPPENLWTNEYPLYTDAHITGQVLGVGPYDFLNGLAFDPPRPEVEARPGVVLRVLSQMSEGPMLPEDWVTSHAGYHGGHLVDEVASLLSLCLGCRFMAGGSTRTFSPGGDPKGLPQCNFRVPLLPLSWRRNAIVPSARGTHSLNDAEELFVGLRDIPASKVWPLIIAARSYQQGLWMSEGEPEMAWLLFVSAIETAAGQWVTKDEDPLETVRIWNEEAYESISKLSKCEATKVAKRLAGLIGAGRKFVSFLMEFKPEAPVARPVEYVQIDWSDESLENAFRVIYRYRSWALHRGTPFPLPMCEAPAMMGDSGASGERPLGIAVRAMGGVWLRDDMPMLLSTFEYIARNALLNWWGALR